MAMIVEEREGWRSARHITASVSFIRGELDQEATVSHAWRFAWCGSGLIGRLIPVAPGTRSRIPLLEAGHEIRGSPLQLVGATERRRP